MNARHEALPHHPAPHRERVALHESLFGVAGGPIAWFVQLCAGYALASWPCFPNSDRGIAPLPGYGWTWPAMIVVLVAGVLVAFAAFLVSWRVFRRTREEAGGGEHELLEVGTGRSRFLALWGMILGGSFTIATALDAVAFILLPRCAG
ncbi:MAG TPA: hypothetical protein VNZ43_09255 [Sphingomonadaceae bacterium]|nr:hypothetical protein [Sphingomonadaceae bacterium]